MAVLKVMARLDVEECKEMVSVVDSEVAEVVLVVVPEVVVVLLLLHEFSCLLEEELLLNRPDVKEAESSTWAKVKKTKMDMCIRDKAKVFV